MQEIRELLCLDWGKKRIGLARASTVARIPEPLASIANDEHTYGHLRKIIAQHHTSAIVVGLPRDMHMHETEQTRLVRQWVAEARSHFLMPFYWQDETATTAHAEGIASAHSSFEKRPDIDSLAASIILQDFLLTPASKRVAC